MRRMEIDEENMYDMMMRIETGTPTHPQTDEEEEVMI